MYSTPYRPANPYKQKDQDVVTVTENDTEETNMDLSEVTDNEEELEEEIEDEEEVVSESMEDGFDDDVEEDEYEDENSEELDSKENVDVTDLFDLFIFDYTDRTVYEDKVSPYNLPLYDLKRLVNVVSNQITDIGEDLVVFKNQNSKSILTSSTEDNFISYGLLKDNHSFSFKGKEVFVEVLDQLVYLASESNITLEGLDEFLGLTVPSNLNNNQKSSTKSNTLLEINTKLDAILDMLKQ